MEQMIYWCSLFPEVVFMHPRPAGTFARQHKFWLKLIVTILLASLLVTLTYFWISQENHRPGYIHDKTYKLTILNTSELVHEHAPSNSGDQLIQRQELISTIRREVEANGGKLLLLSGGELSTDNDLLNLKQLNQLGYNAMAVSPFLFDEPLNTIRTQEATADFPFLSANLYESETGRPVFDAYALFDFDGLNIAVMGITRLGTVSDGLGAATAEYRRGIELIDPVLATAELVPYLRKQADIVIVATHVIHYPKPLKPGSKPFSPVSRVAGIDLLVGHGALPPTEAYGQTETSAPLDTPEYGSAIRRIDLEFRNGKLKKTNATQIHLISKIESAHDY
ncbi:hypothetical protein [Endozoicomonas sp. SCSIO W0465]|uniref:hypothetical protein n=1 Tax=Endozoicomonas sp. SCSIO W0465 TaxID=2918516 RepID=UPI002075303A|nr:hypothetical protein [Endozoicomonas sp. SCSIO W0465]USE36150.1 hypothetical protein MJO57_29600 [Endozoicomonas sp. SCSIO W0465]